MSNLSVYCLKSSDGRSDPLYSCLHFDSSACFDFSPPFFFQVAARASYRSNPFHNFRHAFCVTQMMYAYLCGSSLLTGPEGVLSKMDQAVLLTACVCHDMDHPGESNGYVV